MKKEKYSVGVDLGGTNIKIGIVSNSGRIISKTSLKTEADKGPVHIINQIIAGIDSVLENRDMKIKGIGIGFPGTVSNKSGLVQSPPNLPGWGKVDIRKKIEKKFNKKVVLENDANAAAIGELIFGAGRKYDSFIMVTLGTGVGGGIVINKKIFHGESGAAGELGHVIIDSNGASCNCGSTGCVEAYAGNNYLKNRVKEELPANNDSKLWEIIGSDLQNVSPKNIQRAAEENDKYASGVITDLGVYIGTALTSVSNILDITTFIIGGGISGFGTPLLSSIKDTIVSKVLFPKRKRIKIIPARLKNDAGIKGASALVFYKS
ncbi:MAG: ROK family protein [Ignavibacteriales bacterium]|nr:MAG: ROK family protein [Ignavibacteriales bacterium]